ncbi:MAG: hypothetical protein AAFR61_03515 [Bacteroidota bacterium]
MRTTLSASAFALRQETFLKKHQIQRVLAEGLSGTEQLHRELYQDFLLASSRYEGLKAQLSDGTIAQADAQLEINQLTKALFDLIHALRKEASVISFFPSRLRQPHPLRSSTLRWKMLGLTFFLCVAGFLGAGLWWNQQKLDIHGQVLLNGKAISGVRLKLESHPSMAESNADGNFSVVDFRPAWKKDQDSLTVKVYLPTSPQGMLTSIAIQEIKAGDLVRIHLHEPDIFWGEDESGFQLFCRMVVLSKDFYWEKGGQKVFDNDSLLPASLDQRFEAMFAEAPALRKKMNQVEDLVFLGNASWETDPQLSDSLALLKEEQRAENRALELARYLSNKVIDNPHVGLHTYNLGKYMEETASSDAQRLIVILAILKKDEGINLSEAFLSSLHAKKDALPFKLEQFSRIQQGTAQLAAYN